MAGWTTVGALRRAAVAAVAVTVAGAVGWAGWRAGRAYWLWREVSAAFSEADWVRARRAADRLAWYAPDDPEVIAARVDSALQLGDKPAAVAALAAVRNGSPEAGSAHLRRGLLLKELYRAGDAEVAFLAAARAMPLAPEPVRELIVLYGIERRAAEQEEQLWALHDRAGRAAEALRLLAQSAVVIPPGALPPSSDEGAVLERCRRETPDDPHLIPPLARFYRRRGRFDAAMSLLDAGMRRHPSDADARVEWLASLVDSGDLEAAASWFENPTPAFLGRSDFRGLRGDWLSAQGRSVDALADYREAVRLAPRDAEARYRLAVGLRDAGRADEASKAFEDHKRLQVLATRAAAVSEDAPGHAEVVAVLEVCRSLGPDRRREADAWEALAGRVDPNRKPGRGGPP